MAEEFKIENIDGFISTLSKEDKALMKNHISQREQRKKHLAGEAGYDLNFVAILSCILSPNEQGVATGQKQADIYPDDHEERHQRQVKAKQYYFTHEQVRQMFEMFHIQAMKLQDIADHYKVPKTIVAKRIQGLTVDSRGLFKEYKDIYTYRRGRKRGL
jgi:hypothetical protein